MITIDIIYYHRFISYFTSEINNDCGKCILASIKNVPSYIHIKISKPINDFLNSKQHIFKKYGLDYYFIRGDRIGLSYSTIGQKNTIHTFYRHTNIDKLVKAEYMMGELLFDTGLRCLK